MPNFLLPVIRKFRPEFKKIVLKTDPLVLMWQPRNEMDFIVEIQNKDYRWSDEMINHLTDFADDLTLTTKDPTKPYILVGGNPFQAMQTSLAFSGTSEQAKIIFLAVFMKFLTEGKALTLREDNKPMETKNHVITKKDLKESPELAQKGIEVGQTVKIQVKKEELKPVGKPVASNPTPKNTQKGKVKDL